MAGRRRLFTRGHQYRALRPSISELSRIRSCARLACGRGLVCAIAPAPGICASRLCGTGRDPRSMTACGGHEKMSIHRIVSAAVALLALFAAPHAFGQPAGGAAPQRVEIMVGYGAGTGVDSIARYYADRLQKKTGVPHVVVNKVGVYGNLAAQDVVRATPDGSTILITPNTVLSVNMHLLN